MKRSGFTLIELIFVIVIIGVLAAVAVPKFQNLKQNADAANVLKVANDAFASIPPAYVNLVDLDENETNSTIKFDDIVTTSGKDWNLTTSTQNAQTLYYDDGADSTHRVIAITFNPTERNITLAVDCSKFTDSTTQTKCTHLNGSAQTSKTMKY